MTPALARLILLAALLAVTVYVVLSVVGDATRGLGA